jgi:hypothetical protein
MMRQRSFAVLAYVTEMIENRKEEKKHDRFVLDFA